MGFAVIRARLVLLLLALSSPAYAWGPAVGMIGFGEAAGAPAPTYLASESFDTNPGYDLTWTESAGDPDPDYTPALEGTQSLYLGGQDNALTQTAYVNFTATAGQSQELYFVAKFGAFPSTGSTVFVIFGTGGIDRAIFYARAGGSFGVQPVGGTQVNTTGTVSVGTTCHIWVKYLKGTGANALASIAFSTDGVRPTSGANYAESTNGTGTADATRVTIRGNYSSGTGVNVVVDKVRIDDAAIGDNPS